MEKVNEQITKEERKYGKRTAALVLTIMYMATLSPLYLFAEERRNSASAIENFSPSRNYAPLNEVSLNKKAVEETDEKEILVAEAPAASDGKERNTPVKSSGKEEKVPVIPESAESKLLITKKAGGVIELGRVKIEIPKGAVKEDTEISITRLLKVNETGETIKNVTEENGGYRFLPKGTKFKKKVLISMPYSAELNLTEGELNELYTYFYDEEKAAWIKLERKEIDKENCLVKSYTTHFTDMINATLAMPEVTGPVDFNINSIKGLEAAKPDSHLIKFNSPQGTSSGDAAFSFTLDVPAGRKGMQPQISVGYSSAGGNGIMGKGFDVNYGSTISIDTRKKLPDYDESDAYLKDGVKLKANGSTNKEYRLLRRSVREKIERHNAFSKDDWWEIIDTHGTVYRYGYYKAYETTTNNAYAGKKDENGKDKIYTWYLSEVEDVDGNTILYEYEKDKEYVYPFRITYTGNVNNSVQKKGKYIVKFNYIKHDADNRREDVRVDARSRFVTECRWLLDSIESGHADRITRKYSFEYKEGLAKEKYLTAFNVSNGTTEKDSSYTYRFEYNELEKIKNDNETVTYKIFDEPKIWLSSEDKINEVFNNQIPGKNDLDINNVSMSSSSSTGYNVNASFGVGVGREVFDARGTGGGGGSSSSGTGYTNTVLIDINGDGISDIVKQNGNSIDVYLCNYDREAKTFSYSATASNQYIGTQINLEETESSSTSYNVYGGGGASVIGAGYSYAHTDSSGSTQTKTGFADVDGDGLVDIVTGSTTYLRNTSKGNEISFEKKTIKGYASSRVKKLSTAEKNEYSMQFMAQRPFRAWKVKNSGKIDVKQNITGNESLKGNVYIDGSKNPASASQLKSLEIRDGQYIFFVPDLKSGKDDWNTEFNWNIQIDYNTVKPFLSNDNEIILALPCAAELYNPSSRNSSIKDKNLIFLSDLYEPREDTSSGSGYATYYAGLKNGYESIELTETQRLIILNGEYFIPKRIENYKAAGNASFIGLLKRAAEPPKSDIYPDKRGAVKTVLDSYKYDYVNDCFRYKNNRTTAAEKQTLREALKTVGYSYEKFLGDYRKDFAGITIGNSGLAKPVLYAAVTGREENNSQRKVNTRGRLSDKIIIIDDDILGEKIEEFNLNPNPPTGPSLVKCGNNFIYSGFEGDNEQPVIKIADKENKYIISYCFGNLTYAVPELSDEEFEKIYNSEYMNGSITDGIINNLKALEETPEGKDYKIINKDSARQVVEDAFASAIAQNFLNENDADDFISIVLDPKDDDYELKILSDDDNNKIKEYDNKLKLADFISNDFSYYFKAEDDSPYWTLKSGLEKEEKEDLENICKRYGFGLYQNFYKKIDYIKDGEYVVSDSKYNVLILEGNTWENKPINFTEAKNNSFEQYSNKDLTVRESNAKIGSYSAPYLDKRGNIATKPVDLTIENEDTLYGGVNSWLYGIWQGNQTENPFSKEKLVNRTTKEINEDDYKDYDEEEMARKYETDVKDNGENVKEKFDLSYYLPLDTTGYEKEGVWNAECGIEKESLTGNIDIKESQTVTDANGRMAVVRTTVYSAPYIYKDKIVCNRLGGDTYYNIEGISQSSSVGTFCISKSRNKNKETSHGPQVKAAVIDLSGSFSDGSGNSYQEQSFQDVTGDRIPDIIQSDGKKLTVKKGILEGKNLFFEDYDVSGISNYISVSENGNSTKSAGVGLSSPAAEPKYNAKGIAKSISMSMGCNGSKGDGYNKQTAGFIDLNGDGITDYVNVDDGEYKIGNGQDFKTESFFAGFIPLQESGFDVTGLNVDYGAGGGITNKTIDEDLLNKLKEAYKNTPTKIPECAQKLSCSVNVGVGFGSSTSTSSVDRMYLDVNGDGLTDIVKKSGSSTAVVMFNTGSSFTSSQRITLPKWDDTNKENPLTSNVSTTVTLNGSLGVSVNVSVPVWLITINFTTSVGGGNNTSSTTTVADITMTDLDGDGKVDQVLQLADGSVYWKKNLTGKAGLLNSIYLPQGGKYEIEYEGEYGTTYNPGFKYVMSEVKVSDGTEAILPQIKIINDDDDEEKDTHEFITRYSYEDAYFDREEKDSYGYNKVKTKYPDDTYGVTQYSTKTTEYSYNLLGATMTSEVYSSEQKGYKDNEGCMSSTDIEYFNEEEWTLPKTETSVIYEKDGGYIESTTEYGYDEDSNEEYGNVTSVKQTTSDSTVPEVYAYITYDAGTADKYIVSNPSSIKVFDHKSSSEGGDYLRYRTGRYDGNGHLDSLSQYYEGSKELTTTFTYDETYGNIKSITDPAGVTLEYGYDTEVNQFIESITQKSSDAKTYTCTIEYDKKQQIKTKETDCNGNSMEYGYDNWQRIVSIKSPKDSNGIKAISYEYYCPDTKVKKTQDGLSKIEQHAFWTAVTKNKVNFDSDKVIETVVQTDGLGGVFRTAKTGVKFNPGTKESEKGWNVSGAAVKDEKGRTVKAGQSYFIDDLDITSLNDVTLKLKYATETEYDEKDREIKIKTPFDLDNADEDKKYAEVKKEYGIVSRKFITTTEDALGNITEQTVDAKGNIVAILKRGVLVKTDKVTGEKVEYGLDDLAKTTYEYDALGQMTAAYDIGGNETKVVYDLLGRKTEISTIDGGTYYYIYDDIGNLSYTTNSRLLANGKQINYSYDSFNRLIKVIYPDTPETVYEYGSPNCTVDNARGRLLKLTDSSGTTEYEYGELGEVVKEKRTLKQRHDINAVPVTAVMEYKSNYLGQMEEIKYPDGETVTYEYDGAGQVCAVKGSHNRDGSYVEKIGYDEFGQRVYIKYGNGVETTYSYKKETRLLESIETLDDYRNKRYQNIKYNFDKAGNVLGYTNNCMENGASGNYITSQSYSYDNLYQLIGASGETEFNKYNIAGAPTFKGRYSQSYEFDSLGNMKQKVSSEKISVGTKTGDSLNYSFDYEIAEGFVHRYSKIGTRYYRYDEVGNITVEQEGAFGEEGDGDYYKIDKHDEDVYGVNEAWGYYIDSGKEDTRFKNEKYHREFTWDEKNQLIKSVDNTVEVSFVYGEDGKRTNKYTSTSETLYFNSFWTYNNDGSTSFKGGAVSKHIFLGETRLLTAINDYDDAVRGAYGTEKDHIYYYHSDHLGSAQLVTNSEGEEYQRIEYTPYGETWVDVKVQGNKELVPLSYRFSAKELDKETGFYYYGARYLDPKYSRWISADPAMNTGEYFPVAPVDDEAKKHNGNLPGMGGIFNHINGNLYHYAANNPIKYTDPDGRWVPNEDGSYTAEEGDTLWGLSQLTGRDWRDTDYSGRPEDLQVNQTVRFKTVAEKLDSFASFVGDTTGALGSGFEQFGKAWHITSKVPNQWVYPLPTLPDPDLMRTSQNLKDVSTAFLIFGLTLDVYDGVYTGVQNHSFWRGLYRTIGNLASTGAGYFVGGTVTAALTAGSFGTAAIPGVIVGTASGIGTSKAVSWLFKKGEEWIWGK